MKTYEEGQWVGWFFFETIEVDREKSPEPKVVGGCVFGYMTREGEYRRQAIGRMQQSEVFAQQNNSDTCRKTQEERVGERFQFKKLRAF